MYMFFFYWTNRNLLLALNKCFGLKGLYNITKKINVNLILQESGTIERNFHINPFSICPDISYL